MKTLLIKPTDHKRKTKDFNQWTGYVRAKMRERFENKTK